MKRLSLFPLTASLVMLYLLVGAGCQSRLPIGKVEARPSAPLPLDLSKGAPNELGVVPILEYHELIQAGARGGGYKYPLDAFRQDMERLYKLGYRPISLHEFVSGHMDVPAGLSPVVITFDDALRGQVDFDNQGNLKPNCAAGVLEAMHAEHKDWPLKATFFVLPMRGTETYFYQKAFSQRKLKWLVANGFELGNHTVNHLPGMSHFTDAQVMAEFAGAAALIDKYVPGYKVDTLALPFGVYPKHLSLVISGESGGVSYHNICALKAGAGPAPPPASPKFKPYLIPRMIPGARPMEIDWWLTYLQKHKAMRYVSDGDASTVTVPDTEKGEVVVERIKSDGLFFRTYTLHAPSTAAHSAPAPAVIQ